MTSPSSFSSQPPQRHPLLRASDVDREAVVEVLHDAVLRGLLTLEEGDARVRAAYSAKYLRDLPSMTADLPPAPPPAPVAPGWRAVATLAWLQLRTALAAASWRGARVRPRVAIAILTLVAMLSVAVGTASGFDHHHPQGPGFEHFQHR